MKTVLRSLKQQQWHILQFSTVRIYRSNYNVSLILPAQLPSIFSASMHGSKAYHVRLRQARNLSAAMLRCTCNLTFSPPPDGPTTWTPFFPHEPFAVPHAGKSVATTTKRKLEQSEKTKYDFFDCHQKFTVYAILNLQCTVTIKSYIWVAVCMLFIGLGL